MFFEVIKLFLRKSRKKNKLQRGIFITITILIAVGLVVPLAGLFQQTGGNPAETPMQSAQSLEEEITDLEARVAENPEDTDLLMELAETSLYAGKPEKSIATYGKVLAAEPENSRARINIATVYYYSSNYEQATEHLQELLKNEPDNKSAHYLYGVVLATGKKDYAAGIEEMEKFIALTGEGPDVERAKQAIKEWKAAQEKG